MEFLSLSRRRSSSRNVPNGEERGETDVFQATICQPFRQICQGGNGSWELHIDVLKSEIFWRRQVLDLLIFIDTWYEELGRSWSVLSASAFGLGARSCLNVFNWKYPWQNPWTKFSRRSMLLHIIREPKLTSIDVKFPSSFVVKICDILSL